MRKQYVRKTEETAKRLVKRLLKTGDLVDFINSVSDYSYNYGIYGAKNRYLFLDEVKKLIKERDIGIV